MKPSRRRLVRKVRLVSSSKFKLFFNTYDLNSTNDTDVFPTAKNQWKFLMGLVADQGLNDGTKFKVHVRYHSAELKATVYKIMNPNVTNVNNRIFPVFGANANHQKFSPVNGHPAYWEPSINLMLRGLQMQAMSSNAYYTYLPLDMRSNCPNVNAGLVGLSSVNTHSGDFHVVANRVLSMKDLSTHVLFSDYGLTNFGTDLNNVSPYQPIVHAATDTAVLPAFPYNPATFDPPPGAVAVTSYDWNYWNQNPYCNGKNWWGNKYVNSNTNNNFCRTQRNNRNFILELTFEPILT